jgi:hypothetical protein
MGIARRHPLSDHEGRSFAADRIGLNSREFRS